MSRLLLTLDEVADQLAVSRRTVNRLVAEGHLPVVWVRGAKRVTIGDLHSYVDKAQTKP
jgi:excisionase family DNA binding protein